MWSTVSARFIELFHDTRLALALFWSFCLRRGSRLYQRLRQPAFWHSPFGVICLSLVALAAVSTIGATVWVVSAWRDLPDSEAIGRIHVMDRATTVYDQHDRFAFSIARERRLEIPLTAISPTMIQAILAIEDRRFYTHPGFDLTRIASAAIANVRRRRAAQGASTITQQLARQSFLTADKTLRRKVQELLLARRIERAYSKPRILELYLNKVYFGDGLYGIEAASRGYLAKHAAELSVDEAALLAGLVKSPSSDSPTVNLKRAVARRNQVLRALRETGVIDQATWQTSQSVPVRLRDGLRGDERHAQYLKEQVRRELAERFGSQAAYQDGLRVYSTLDMPMQIAAEAVLADSLKAVEARRSAWTGRRATAGQRSPAIDTNEPLQGALIALDPATGDVRVMIGGRDFADSSFNRAVQARRQPGSAFKPIVYAAALEGGYTAATIIDHLDDPIATEQGLWTPEEQHVTAPSMSVRTALRTSSNRAAVRALQEVGMAPALQLAEKMGLGKLPGVPSLALGPGEVTLQSLTAAYAAFAHHGLLPHPSVIRRVEDAAGHVLYETQPSSQRVMSDETAFLMSSLLADVVNSGTAARVRALGFTVPAAGKTGTTSDFNDAWFVGYTPKLVAGVWMGFDEPRTILPDGFAAEIAVPVWANFMKRATRGDTPDWIAAPTKVTSVKICRLSGKLATPGCADIETTDGPDEHRAMVYTEYFVRGTEPTEYCDRHQSTNLLAVSLPPPGNDKPPLVEEPGVAPLSAINDLPGEDAPPPAPPKKKSIWSRIFGR